MPKKVDPSIQSLVASGTHGWVGGVSVQNCEETPLHWMEAELPQPPPGAWSGHSCQERWAVFPGGGRWRQDSGRGKRVTRPDTYTQAPIPWLEADTLRPAPAF